MKRSPRALLLLLSLLSGFRVTDAAGAEPPLTVFAASSLTDALKELEPGFASAKGRSLRFSFAASSALAKQIEAGADADVFISADSDWMDYLDRRNLIRRESRLDLLGNSLVLIAPAASEVRLKLADRVDLSAALGADGRLAIADPESVPAGRYGRTALLTLHAWQAVAGRLVRAENVRAAMVFVARGEAPLGIVYQSDVVAETLAARGDAGKIRVKVVDRFPPDTHPPIVYPIAASAHSGRAASEFIEYLRQSQSARTFERFGFEVRTNANP